MNKIGNLALAILMGTAILLMFEFVLINFILGCETWDKDYWTEYNSCVTISHMLGLE